MKVPRMSISGVRRLEKTGHALRLVFKIGLPLGVGIIVVGTVIAGLHDPQRSGNEVPPRVSAVGEMVMAIACVALASNCLLEAWVFLHGFAKSVRFAISGVLPYVLAGVLLGGGAIVLGVMATRDWMRL
jgi:hypothetical protein